MFELEEEPRHAEREREQQSFGNRRVLREMKTSSYELPRKKMIYDPCIKLVFPNKVAVALEFTTFRYL